LRRTHFCWFGLIGSMTKRMQFEHRLQERGIPAVRLRDMVCPIGLKGITGKQPAVIAASVAAQLLQVWEAFEQGEIDLAASVDVATTAAAIISPAAEGIQAPFHQE
jgi:xanthine dehydrogenase accessory factor